MGNKVCRKCRNGPQTSSNGPNSDINKGAKAIDTTFEGIPQTQVEPEPQPELKPAPSCPTPPFPNPKAEVVVAIYPYEGRTDGDLSFKKEDLLEVIDGSGDWWYARDRKTGSKGYIPCNYVAPYKSLKAEP